MKKIKPFPVFTKLTTIAITITWQLVPFFALAQEFDVPNPLDPITSFPGLICLFARVVFWFALPLALLALLFAALLFMTSGGNEQKLRQAKEALFYAIIGWGIVIIAQAIALVIVTFVGGKPVSFTQC